MTEARFAVSLGTLLVVIAVCGSAGMTMAGMEKDRVATITVTVMGFAALMFSQRRDAAMASGKADEVKDALLASNATVAARTSQVARSLAASDAKNSRQLDEIQATGNAVKVLVNSGHAKALESNALLSAKIAAAPGATDEDRQAATDAAHALAQHRENQGAIDSMAERVEIQLGLDKDDRRSTAPAASPDTNAGITSRHPDEPPPRRPLEEHGLGLDPLRPGNTTCHP